MQQKLQAIQHRKLFMERLRKFCTLVGDGEPLFDLLPRFVLDAIYENRCTTPKIRVAKDVKITKRFVRIFYSYLEKDMKSNGIDLLIPGFAKRVSLVDYYQVAFPLECVLQSKTCYFMGREKFDAFCTCIEERYHKYVEEFVNTVHCICHAYCDLSKRILYTFEYEMQRTMTVIDGKSYTGVIYQIITLGTYPLEVRHVAIHGDRRLVVQTGEIVHRDNVSSLNPTTVPLRRLHVADPSGKKEIPVYVQQHAIDRTMQRACCIEPGSVPALIHNAFYHKRKIIREGDRYLVECFYYDIKIGYFVGTIVDGLFVILTFLFITHSSTPEGRKLAALTGLKREDMAFLAIDNLKTLINSDIADDERIARIFTEAGCESILKMNFQLSIGYYDWLWDDTKQDSELSKLIAEYIQLGDSDEDYFENE
ncbi:MAG: hypothetical protein LBF85_05405 [Tannerella sp.]|jgi:hypothetical protein|nr:hypothetical protein [Tannerella sp.]